MKEFKINVMCTHSSCLDSDAIQDTVKADTAAEAEELVVDFLVENGVEPQDISYVVAEEV